MDKLAELLRQGADKLVNLPTEAQRFVTNPQAFIQLLTGKNALPRETGFAAGATGLPAQQGTVLDPNYQAYMQGYEQGEPVSYAAMATPAALPVAKALAPKAGQMAEQYMVNQGFMPSLIAYHGTPHTIKGKFDISKVGTGEGAQAYGHGMYFAENPAVAKEYQRALSNPEIVLKSGERISNPTLGTGEDVAKAWLEEQFLQGSKNPFDDAITKVTKLRNSANSPAQFDEATKILNNWKSQGATVDLGGNLYKVDIPDADIPNMLNWNLPINQQSAKVQEIAKQLDPNLLADTPHLIVRGQPRHWTEVVDSLEDLQNPKVIKLLKKIYGESAEVMPYGDYLASKMTGEQLYRNLSNPTQWSKEAAPYAMKAGMEDAAVSARLNELGVKGIRYKDAMSRGADEGTSNFVVFEPSTVKILEKNNQPVTRKELIQQQIDKIE